MLLPWSGRPKSLLRLSGLTRPATKSLPGWSKMTIRAVFLREFQRLSLSRMDRFSGELRIMT